MVKPANPVSRTQNLTNVTVTLIWLRIIYRQMGHRMRQNPSSPYFASSAGGLNFWSWLIQRLLLAECMEPRDLRQCEHWLKHVILELNEWSRKLQWVHHHQYVFDVQMSMFTDISSSMIHSHEAEYMYEQTRCYTLRECSVNIGGGRWVEIWQNWEIFHSPPPSGRSFSSGPSGHDCHDPEGRQSTGKCHFRQQLQLLKLAILQ